MTDDGSTSFASVYHTLSRFLPFSGAIADIHKIKIYSHHKESLKTMFNRPTRQV